VTWGLTSLVGWNNKDKGTIGVMMTRSECNRGKTSGDGAREKTDVVLRAGKGVVQDETAKPRVNRVCRRKNRGGV